MSKKSTPEPMMIALARLLKDERTRTDEQISDVRQTAEQALRGDLDLLQGSAAMALEAGLSALRERAQAVLLLKAQQLKGDADDLPSAIKAAL